ncbi:MAG TPA: SDR family oxidoreductase, partial [Thermoanaerobaculia bacterium]|nr:SDR family oxidoreductase [Thermoanaerobaculia bacterium]
RPQYDIRRPLLGLDLRDVTEIIHCAADTRFGLPLDEARATNVVGTENVLDVARRCPRLEKFAHISTVYVAGQTAGRIAETFAVHGNVYTNTYQQSKHEAEERVVRAMAEIPASIYRFSTIIGTEQPNYVHQLIRLLPKNIFPVAPGDPEALVDLIPTDAAIDALATMFASRFVPGSVHQFCAGAEGSMTVREVIDRAAAIVKPKRIPELVPLDEYERFVERRLDDRLFREIVRVTNLFLPHLAIRQIFDNDSTRAATPAYDIRETYDDVVRFCVSGRQ